MQPTTTGDGKAPTLISSVNRALTVLDCLGSAARPLSAKSIARATSLSLGTAYNVLRTLAHSGYVVQDQDGFVLGPAHPAMAPSGDGVAFAHERAVLNGIRDELQAAAYLSRYHDGEIEIVDIVDGPFAPRVDLWVGLQDSAHATALGKQILAALDPAARLDYIARHPLVELTPYTIRTPREFIRALERNPTTMVDDQEYSLGNTCLAVPVTTSSWVGAVAISVPAGRRAPGVDHTAVDRVRVLRRAAERLALFLGVGTAGFEATVQPASMQSATVQPETTRPAPAARQHGQDREFQHLK
ncbi:IclR family transcriptional regulator [Specibacter cremeus]|uniref:IclR family transcriptional regulator n=1 Tax=Specibacter cremeus TaxID=1629051 RepID=UPI000F7BA4AE|nr:IclR family transcriptional regulator C-terminal domain-containing protein [Specibacter cremeus]